MRKQLAAAGLAMALAMSLAGCGSGQVTIKGTMLVTKNFTWEDEGTPAPCSTKGGYSDIAPGAGVTVKDAHGEIIAKSELGPGAAIRIPDKPGKASACAFFYEATFPDDGGKFYTVEVTRRGELVVERPDGEKELESVATL